MPKPASPPNRTVAAIVYDGIATFEFGIVAEVFGLDRPEMGADWYRLITCAADKGPMRAAGGLTVTVDHDLEDLTEAGTIVIAGWKGIDVAPPEPLLDALRHAYARGARIVSLCSGAFVLAAAGLLDGGGATTHWRYADAFKKRFPQIALNPDVLYVDRGNVLTSAGSAAGIDLLLHIVRSDFGSEAANSVARRMVVPAHRDGGQSQFIERPVPPRADGKLAALLEFMRQRMASPMTISMLASEAAMSERTFLRRFKEMTGLTPADWLLNVRLDYAKQLLETSSASIEDISMLAGFGSAATLRMHFRNAVGISPRDYRSRFSHAVADFSTFHHPAGPASRKDGAHASTQSFSAHQAW
jgi:AraC family transcriptional regulator, transcriptional activator FtrA